MPAFVIALLSFVTISAVVQGQPALTDETGHAHDLIAALPLSDKSNVTFHSHPGLYHLFIAGTGRSLPAEYQIAGHVDEAVIRDMADWIKK